MAMSPGVRRFALTVHVACSVGWLGAVAVFLALAVTGLTSRNAQLTRAVHVAMDLAVWQVIVPLSLAALTTGLIQSLGSVWGLFRHYWVLFKLLLTLFATAFLLGYAQSTGHLAELASDPTASGAALDPLRNPTHVIHSAGGLLVLLTVAVLAIYKPPGLTRYGHRKRYAATRRPGADPSPEESP